MTDEKYIKTLEKALKQTISSIDEIDRELCEHANPFLEGAIEQAKYHIKLVLKIRNVL